MNYMCTLSCPYYVLTMWICTCIHSASFKDSIIIRIYLSNCFVIYYCQLFKSFVHYSDSGNVCQVFWSCPSVTRNTSSSKSINLLQYRICAWFRFSIGFSKAYCNACCEARIYDTIFPNWVEEGKIVVTITTAMLIPQLWDCWWQRRWRGGCSGS